MAFARRTIAALLVIISMTPTGGLAWAGGDRDAGAWHALGAAGATLSTHPGKELTRLRHSKASPRIVARIRLGCGLGWSRLTRGCRTSTCHAMKSTTSSRTFQVLRNRERPVFGRPSLVSFGWSIALDRPAPADVRNVRLSKRGPLRGAPVAPYFFFLAMALFPQPLCPDDPPLAAVRTGMLGTILYMAQGQIDVRQPVAPLSISNGC